MPTLLACLFFGLTDAIQIRLQGVAIFGDQPIPVQFIQVLPYVFTVLVLAGFMGKSRPPKALGSPWLSGILLVAFLSSSGCEFPGSSVAPSAKSVSTSVDDLRSPAARRSRENSELLAEMIRVLFGREAQDPRVFSQYHASLNQGASLEGILNGLTHSAAYRELETKSGPATSLARAFFVDELVKIQEGLVATGHDPFSLYDSTPKPLAKSEFPTGTPSVASSKNERAWKYESKSSPATYAKAFSMSSAPTLRRVLVEAVEARVDGFLSPTSPEYGTWFAELASRLAGAGVDFGVALRNKADVASHLELFGSFVKTRTPAEVRDRIVWECLNRYLRVLNHLEKK